MSNRSLEATARHAVLQVPECSVAPELTYRGQNHETASAATGAPKTSGGCICRDDDHAASSPREKEPDAPPSDRHARRADRHRCDVCVRRSGQDRSAPKLGVVLPAGARLRRRQVRRRTRGGRREPGRRDGDREPDPHPAWGTGVPLLQHLLAARRAHRRGDRHRPPYWLGVLHDSRPAAARPRPKRRVVVLRRRERTRDATRARPLPGVASQRRLRRHLLRHWLARPCRAARAHRQCLHREPGRSRRLLCRRLRSTWSKTHMRSGSGWSSTSPRT